MGIVIETFAGDSAPALNFTLTREDGSIVNLTGAQVRFTIQDPSTGLITNNPSGSITNSCTITNALAGQCTYTWNLNGTDCPNAGIYKAEIKIRYSAGVEETYPVNISAVAPLYGAIIS